MYNADLSFKRQVNGIRSASPKQSTILNHFCTKQFVQVKDEVNSGIIYHAHTLYATVIEIALTLQSHQPCLSP